MKNYILKKPINFGVRSSGSWYLKTKKFLKEEKVILFDVLLFVLRIYAFLMIIAEKKNLSKKILLFGETDHL